MLNIICCCYLFYFITQICIIMVWSCFI